MNKNKKVILLVAVLVLSVVFLSCVVFAYDEFFWQKEVNHIGSYKRCIEYANTKFEEAKYGAPAGETPVGAVYWCYTPWRADEQGGYDKCVAKGRIWWEKTCRGPIETPYGYECTLPEDDRFKEKTCKEGFKCLASHKCEEKPKCPPEYTCCPPDDPDYKEKPCPEGPKGVIPECVTPEYKCECPFDCCYPDNTYLRKECEEEGFKCVPCAEGECVGYKCVKEEEEEEKEGEVTTQDQQDELRDTEKAKKTQEDISENKPTYDKLKNEVPEEGTVDKLNFNPPEGIKDALGDIPSPVGEKKPVAYILTDPELSTWHRMISWMWKKKMMAEFRLLGYEVIDAEVSYGELGHMTNPNTNTQALVYIGHNKFPTIGYYEPSGVQNAARISRRKQYRKEGMSVEEAKKKATAGTFQVKYLYVHSCNSLGEEGERDTSLFYGQYGLLDPERGIGYGAQGNFHVFERLERVLPEKVTQSRGISK